MRTNTHPGIQTSIHTYIYTPYIHSCTHEYIHTYIRTYIHSCTHIHRYIHTYLYTPLHNIHTSRLTLSRPNYDMPCINLLNPIPYSCVVCMHKDFAESIQMIQTLLNMNMPDYKAKNRRVFTNEGSATWTESTEILYCIAIRHL